MESTRKLECGNKTSLKKCSPPYQQLVALMQNLLTTSPSLENGPSEKHCRLMRTSVNKKSHLMCFCFIWLPRKIAQKTHKPFLADTLKNSFPSLKQPNRVCGMKVSDPNPAQRQIVHELIDWEIAEQRLQRFPAIGRAFPVECLRSHQETPPYYCHYMAWRL